MTVVRIKRTNTYEPFGTLEAHSVLKLINVCHNKGILLNVSSIHTIQETLKILLSRGCMQTI